ncbi:MAG: 5-oxoprolinase subunit PxpB [Chitinophagaceae bacterium]
MNNKAFPYCIFSLGDRAITIDFGNRIDELINETVIQLCNKLRQYPFPGMIEAVPAYSSLTIYYDIIALRKIVPAGSTVFEWMKRKAEEMLSQSTMAEPSMGRLIKIPVCYEAAFAPDLPALAAAKDLSTEEVISIHTSKQYKVYMLGFLPGFAYMGRLDERIEMPRKTQPQNIAEGSVGIAGQQTGIYPLASPGGWQIIGRTPLKLVDVNNQEPTLLKAGDRVTFYSITKNEFDSY